MSEPIRGQRFIQNVYSLAARRLYEPIVVHGSFRLFGGNLDRLVREQGIRAAVTADGRPLLDIPIGTAYYTDTAARAHSGLLIGADIARGMVEKARDTMESKDISDVSVLQTSIHALPFPDDSLGSILCTNGLQVIPALDNALTELARVLIPGAVLYASVLSLPLSGIMRKARLPTILVSGDDVASAIAATGLEITSLRKQRLATLIEARKPVSL